MCRTILFLPLLVSFLLSGVLSAQGDDTINKPAFVPFDKLIGSDFQANVTYYGNFPGSSRSIHLMSLVYYDIRNKAGRFDVYSGGKTAYLYRTDPKQVVTITDANTCRVDSTEYNEFFDSEIAWGWSAPQIWGPAAILFRKWKELPVYTKTTKIRGITCYQFDAVDDANSNIKLTYYITATGWLVPAPLKHRAPVRVVASGPNLKSTWDFLHFQADVHDRTAFQIPAGIGCSGYSYGPNSKELPSFTNEYSFTFERADLAITEMTNNLKVISWKVWYDYEKKISKIWGTEVDSSVAEIRDHNTGVIYHITEEGECSVTSFENTKHTSDMNDIIDRMKDPKEFLNLKGSNQYYIGKDIVRGMEVDVWEGISSDVVIRNDRYNKAVVTFYFTQPKTEVVAGGTSETVVPVLVKITPLLDGTGLQAGTFELNYFDFEESRDRDIYTEMNVENCFPDDNQRNIFTMSFPVNQMLYEDAVRKAKMFEALVSYAIESSVLISPLRLSILQVDYDPELITVAGRMLERPPVINGFVVDNENRFPPNIGTEERSTEKSENDCAVLCTDQISSCTGFTICPAGVYDYDCYPTKETDLKQWPQKIETQGCKFYIKLVRSETSRDLPLMTAIDRLETKVKNKELQVLFMNSNEELVIYAPNQIRTGLTIVAANNYTDETDKTFIPFDQLIGSDFQMNVTYYGNAPEKVHLSTVVYQDLRNKKGRFVTYVGNKTATYLYRANPKQVVSISDGNICRVDNDANNEFFKKELYWGWSALEDQVWGPAAILFRNTTKTPEFKARVSIRGILCDRFEATDQENPSNTISYCLTASSWRVPGPVQVRAPVVIEVYGPNVRSAWYFTHFKADVHDGRVFQIPAGIGCEGYTSGSNPPELPEISRAYSFTYELTDLVVAQMTKNMKVINSKVWYDSQKKILKILGSEVDGSLEEIQDFNTGIIYHLKGERECIVTSLNSSLARKNLTELINVMRNPKELLGLDGNYYYIGKDVVRGIEVDVWETIKEIDVLQNERYKKGVITAYFTQSKTEVVAGGTAETQIPVMVKITPLLDTGLQAGTFQLNYFGFDESTNRDFYSEMNVENCFPDENQRNLFTLSIPVNQTWYEAAVTMSKMFELNVGYAIEEAALISPLRLPVVKVNYEPNLITVEGVMLERAPVINGFYTPDDKRYTPNVGTEPRTTEPSEDDCAVKCIDQMNNCTGFTTCPSGNRNTYGCYLTTETDLQKWPKELNTQGCRFYLKAVQSETTRDLPLVAAIGRLEAKVKSKDLQVIFLNKAGDLITYIPDKIETGLKIGKETEFDYFVKVLEGRKLQQGASTTLVVKEVTSVAECSKRCVDEKSIPCATFSYCASKHECFLTALYLKPGTDQGTEVATSCTVYHKNAITFFEKMKGRTSKSVGAKSVQRGSPEECALACREETTFECKGFDFCNEDKSCSLSKEHSLDLPPLSESSFCTHYSRKFSLDYDIKGHQLVWRDGRSVSVEAATVEVCAKICSNYETQQNVWCKSFNFCPEGGRGKSLCQINMDTMNDPGVKIIPEPDCLHYQSFITEEQTEEILGDRVTNKSFNATLACLFFLGIALGMGAFLSYSYYRKKKDAQNGATVRYTKDVE